MDKSISFKYASGHFIELTFLSCCNDASYSSTQVQNVLKSVKTGLLEGTFWNRENVHF